MIKKLKQETKNSVSNYFKNKNKNFACAKNNEYLQYIYHQ